MTPDPTFFRDLAFVLVAAVGGATLAWLARQPLILGYVVGGLLISPLTPGPAVSDVHTFELFAEIGVILLMFSIGLEFSLADLLRVKWVAIAGGPLGIALTALLAVVLGRAVGWALLESVIIGLVVSVASTMVLGRLLLDRGELHSRHGRIMIGITLVEDLAVVVLTVLIPTLGALEPGRLLTIAEALGLAALVLVPFFYVASRMVPRILLRVARTRSRELFLLASLAIGLGTAALTQAVGLSLALGAFLAGLVISESDYAHETLSRLLPLRDTFVAFFFVTIGALIDPRAVLANLPLLGTLVALIVFGKLLVWTLVVRLFGQPTLTALLVGVGLTQIGEFSFILVQVARAAGHVGDDVYNATLAASLLTILINAALIRFATPRLARAGLALRGRQVETGPPPALTDHVVLCGYGRVGSGVAEALETFRKPHVAIELDPDVVQQLRSRGVHCVFGDASERSILHAAGTERAALVVVALPEIEHADLAVRRVRELNPRVAILARAHSAEGRDRLVEANATEVVQPEMEAAAALIDHALRRLALPPARVADYLGRFRQAMEAAAEETSAAGDALPQLRDVPIGAGELADQSLREARIRERFGVTVVAIAHRAGETTLHPSPDAILRPGDVVRAFGLPAQVEDFARHATGEG